MNTKSKNGDAAARKPSLSFQRENQAVPPSAYDFVDVASAPKVTTDTMLYNHADHAAPDIILDP